MTASHRDKRTKEQLLQILSNALTQEEQLGEKIKTLENQLAACQQQQEDAQAEVHPYGSSASKESFRVDYYKASENGRLKGIIEHLPTRQKKSFQGLGIKRIALFMERFLPEEAKAQRIAAMPLPPSSPNERALTNMNAESLVENSAPATQTQDIMDGVPSGRPRLIERLRAENVAQLLEKQRSE